ncbi:MAG: CooT family nickel-binding protein [Nitrososphaerota archaeon]|nr:CooT family nickel-binding protein [Nitrososphaerales archaeon]MCX8191886.1 CooT family nickel-binding protein [Nitrososphaerales archaeon]MDW8044471.1 CooT family nickel-binding protein [Nitrososphaerota archaeon]
MCESNVYLVGKDKEPFMRDVVFIDVEGNQIRLRDIMGLERVVQGRIIKIDFVNHSLFIKEY